jgi:uncharacterized protein
MTFLVQLSHLVPPAARREWLRPWKLATLAIGVGLMIAGVDFYRISDWDVGISILMPLLTYLCAPWCVRVFFGGRFRLYPAALFWTWFTVDGIYWWYHRFVGNDMLRVENLHTSTPLFLFMGCVWLYRGSLRELQQAIVRRQPLQLLAGDVGSPRRQELMIAGLAGVLFLYALVVEPYAIEVTRHRLGQGGGKPLRVLQISDVHQSRLGWREALLARRVEGEAPDVIVLTGDYVERAADLPAFERLLDELPKVPTYAVLGNWEYKRGNDGTSDPAGWRALFARHGVRLLVNESAVVRSAAGAFRLTGLDDHLAGDPDLKLAIAQVREREWHLILEHTPAFRDVMLSLAPAEFKAARARTVMLSGHTHGGQLDAFGRVPVLPPGAGGYVRGWTGDDGGIPIYISRGIGTSVLPLRFGVRPEIAVFELAVTR